MVETFDGYVWLCIKKVKVQGVFVSQITCRVDSVDHVDQLDIAPPRGLRQQGDGATTQLSEGNVGNIDLT